MRFLGKHIESTRQAFGLDQIEERDHIKGAATREMISRNTEIKENIQLWDRRVLYEVLMDQQFIERYYRFHPYTDVDRYWVNGQYRQVLTAAREIAKLSEAQDWVNQKLKYTHGYGVCVVPVNEFMEEDANPNFWVKGIYPMESTYPELAVTHPQIYYGELTKDYVIVNTKQKEINPKGEQYQGSGGIKIGSWFRRLCFGTRFDFWRVLLSTDPTPESKVLFWRKIGTRNPGSSKTVGDRISHIAPFLKYDPDPYIVIGDDGQLWWIVDTYITSRSYPNAKTSVDETNLKKNPLYSEPTFDRFNYIRNPAVAIVNAYSGKVNFYFTKANEPITAAYQKTFSNLFKSKDQIPAGLQNHLRYPDYLTRIQAEMYADYHVQEAEIFYPGSDRWNIPQEKYYSSYQTIVPYYAMLKLPGENTPEFVNMVPFSPLPPQQEGNLQQEGRLMNA